MMPLLPPPLLPCRCRSLEPPRGTSRPCPACVTHPLVTGWQVIEELFTYWNLDDADETLEELEDALIVSSGPVHMCSAAAPRLACLVGWGAAHCAS